MLTVSELTSQLKETIEGRFSRVLVRGEVSGFRGKNVRGHLYFQLKDGESCIDAKMWATVAARQKFQLREGMEVIAQGSVDVYAPQGRYSLIVNRLEPVGEGALALAFQQLKERLAAEGLIGDRRRPPRPIPFLPKRIGVVTSRTGAALQDFLRVLHRRHPGMSVLLADSRVQGNGADREVVRAIERLSKTDVDVIVVTRGGGSLEDLWTFNEESVARAIHASPVPVISAIGHEVDFTIADFVADLRVPTPSAAAERLAPVLAELENGLSTYALRLRKAVGRHVLASRNELKTLQGRLSDPRRELNRQRLHLSTLTERMARALRTGSRARREGLDRLLSRLTRQRPQALLARRREAFRQETERLKAAITEALRRRRTLLTKQHLALERLSPAQDLREEAQIVAALQMRLRTKVQAKHAAEVQRLAALHQRLQTTLRAKRTAEGQKLAHLAQTLDALSPLRVMARGYSVVYREPDRHVVQGAGDVQPGDSLLLRFAPSGATTLAECDEVRATVVERRSARAEEPSDNKGAGDKSPLYGDR